MTRKLYGFALGAILSLGFGAAAAQAGPLPRDLDVSLKNGVQLVQCTRESCDESERRFGPNPWLQRGGDSSRVYRRADRDRNWRNNDRRYRDHEYRRDRDRRHWRPRYHSGPSVDFWYHSEPRYVQPRYVEPRRTYRLSEAHYRWCQARWRSYRAYDNTYQPYNGPRRQCISPYV